MRKLDTNKSYNKLGISINRYWEISFRVRRYNELTEPQQHKIDYAIAKCVDEACVPAFRKHIIECVPYKSLDVPYSEAQFKRIKKRIVIELNKVFK